ncbi:MAG: hypothetical protein LBB68_06135 [Treponema sp.]|jgi:hypothetical protein|nr:hypothetical protein [Treponema sp.]
MNKILKNSGIIIYFIIIIILILGSSSIDINMEFNSDDVKMRNIYIGLFFIGIIYCITKFVKKDILFEGDGIVIIKKLFLIKIKKEKYSYTTIVKFIIGRFGEYRKEKYNIYIDQGDDIRKITTYTTYKECIKIIEQIKQKTKKLIYDGTDENYHSEDELFRDYYKMKQKMTEIKNMD